MVCKLQNLYYFCTRKQQNGVVVQLVRIPACHAGGREFESRPYRRKSEERSSDFFVVEYLRQHTHRLLLLLCLGYHIRLQVVICF